MTRNTHKKDKKLHNFAEELHNSSDAELSWQETIDLSPDDEGESGSDIYYFTDEDGTVRSHEFLAQELIPNELAVEDTSKRKSREVLQKLRPGAIDIVNLVRDSDEIPPHLTVPTPKSNAPPLDVRISSEVASDIFPKEVALQPNEVASNKRITIRFGEDIGATDNVAPTRDENARAGEPPILNFSQAELDEYIRYRSEGIAEKSRDWINRSSQALWKATEGDVSYQTMTSLRTFVLDNTGRQTHIQRY